jgi:hypothetical protein
MLTSDLVQKIISAGEHYEAQSESAVTIAELGPFGRINRLPPADWNRATAGLHVENLFPLIRGLTLAERQHRWIGGSVAAVIWVFHELERRAPSLAEVAADWVLANTLNPYLPFGCQNYGARSLAEYREASQLHAQKIQRGLVAQRESEARAAREREIRSQRRSRAALLRRSDVRERIIQELGKIALKEQLELIASDPLYPANFYPTRCADSASFQVVASLSKETRLALLTKLKGKQRGPWGKLKRRLREIEVLPWDRMPWF